MSSIDRNRIDLSSADERARAVRIASRARFFVDGTNDDGPAAVNGSGTGDATLKPVPRSAPTDALTLIGDVETRAAKEDGRYGSGADLCGSCAASAPVERWLGQGHSTDNPGLFADDGNTVNPFASLFARKHEANH